MYRFNLGAVEIEEENPEFKYNKCIGSIQNIISIIILKVRFKYNKCIGSILGYLLTGKASNHLNTTNVSVQSRKDSIRTMAQE